MTKFTGTDITHTLYKANKGQFKKGSKRAIESGSKGGSKLTEQPKGFAARPDTIKEASKRSLEVRRSMAGYRGERIKRQDAKEV